MRRWLFVVLLSISCLCPPALHAAEARLAIVQTATGRAPQGLMYSGGSFTQEAQAAFSAFVVQHGDTVLLFDGGLGSRIAQQYGQDMPLWARPLFRYEEPITPAHKQLEAAGVPKPKAFVLSHSHWDHASALADFPGIEVWLAPEELALVQQPSSAVGGAWPSQVKDVQVTWKPLALQAQPYEGFERSLDVFADGSVVIVAMPGHTPGSIGMFVKSAAGRYFLVGDVVWNAAALPQARPKFWLARWLVDGEAAGTQAMIERIRAAMQRDPALVVIPAHDGGLQQRLGVLPRWLP